MQTAQSGTYFFAFRGLGRNYRGESVRREDSRFLTLGVPPQDPSESAEGGILAFSAHAGLTQPVGDLNRLYDGGTLVELDLEFAFRQGWSLEAVLGRYTFEPDLAITGGILYLRRYLPLGGWRPFVAVGSGVFDPNDGDASFGVSFGAGISQLLTSRLQAELGAFYWWLHRDPVDRALAGIKAGLKVLP